MLDPRLRGEMELDPRWLGDSRPGCLMAMGLELWAPSSQQGGRGLSKTVGVREDLIEGKLPEANADGAPKTGFPAVSAGS